MKVFKNQINHKAFIPYSQIFYLAYLQSALQQVFCFDSQLIQLQLVTRMGNRASLQRLRHHRLFYKKKQVQTHKRRFDMWPIMDIRLALPFCTPH